MHPYVMPIAFQGGRGVRVLFFRGVIRMPAIRSAIGRKIRAGLILHRVVYPRPIACSLLVALLVAAVVPPAAKAINIAAGGTVSESFSVGTSATATLPTDWKVDKNTTVRLRGTYASAVTATEQVGGNSLSGTAAAGIYNFGAGVAASATDRAIGFLSSGSAAKTGNLYVKLVNNGAGSIGSFTISYKVEDYRHGSNAAGFDVQMYYSTDGSTWTSAGADFLTHFNADADNLGYASAPGATQNVTAKTLSVTVAAGGTVYLCWSYSVASGTTTSNAKGLGVDDVSITAVAAATEPSVSTVAASATNTTTATLNGDVTADGGASVTDRGVCFKTSAGVTSSDNKTAASPATGTGTFAVNLSSLAVNQQYFFKAYGINSVNTTLGSELSFTTLANTPGAPTVNNPTPTTLDVSVDANANPSITTFAIEADTDNNGSYDGYVQANGSVSAGAIWQTASAWGTKTVTGLASSQTVPSTSRRAMARMSRRPSVRPPAAPLPRRRRPRARRRSVRRPPRPWAPPRRRSAAR